MIVILMDDMARRDPAFAGGKVAETPNLDRFVKQGAVLRNCYSSAPNCAPTRACLLTGQYTPRHGVFTVIDERYDPGQAH
ncbi:MAG: sulfatase-like hydrolase/transferase, partial [Verrucomicrobiota bacterium]